MYYSLGSGCKQFMYSCKLLCLSHVTFLVIAKITFANQPTRNQCRTLVPKSQIFLSFVGASVSNPWPSLRLDMDVDDFGPILDVVQEGVAFIDRVLPPPCHEEMNLDSLIANRVLELQWDMDKAKAPITHQNMVLSQLFGKAWHANDVMNYTSMGLALASRIAHISKWFIWWHFITLTCCSSRHDLTISYQPSHQFHVQHVNFDIRVDMN